MNEKELLKCPICNCKPTLTGFENTPKKEVNNALYDQVSIHCPGCRVTMLEGRRDLEDEDETIKRIIKKWNNRPEISNNDKDNSDNTEVNVNELIQVAMASKEVAMDVIAKQSELYCQIFGFTNELYDPEVTLSGRCMHERHIKISKAIHSMDIKISLWRFMAVLELAGIILYFTFIK